MNKQNNMIPSFTFSVLTDSAAVEAVTGQSLQGEAVFQFAFSDGVSGWAELGTDGFFCATVSNESECFATFEECAAWLYPRVSRL